MSSFPLRHRVKPLNRIVPSDSHLHEQQLSEVFQTLLEQVEQGRTIHWGEVTSQYPELARELRELVGAAQMARVLGGTSSVPFPDPGVPESPPATRPLHDFADYEQLVEIGRGGMGIVYRAHQRSLNRDVALKMMVRGVFATPDDFRRFRTEAESAAKLSHPHIVSVYEVGEQAGLPYFSMQLVEGETLAQRISRHPLAPREAAKLLIPVCRAIAYAHRNGILHRDLKPSNILLDQVGHPYVSDFGLARIVREEELLQSPLEGTSSSSVPAVEAFRSLTRTGAILGTPGYMAPEQAIGDPSQIGPATDIYSLGAVLFALLTGRSPFQCASPADAVIMALEHEPPPPRLLNPAIDVDLEMIVLKALQKPTDLRYVTADDFADDLQAFLNNEPVAARSSRLADVLSRAFRPTHHAGILRNWGVLWMWHSLVLLVLCLTTNYMQFLKVTSRLPYVGLWTIGLGTWGLAFWSMRHRAGPVTFVERQIAHLWAASMASSTMLFLIEELLGLKVLSLSPVLALFAASVFVGKAGVLSGEFYIQAIVMFLCAIPMALFPDFGLTIFGLVSALTFFIPGWKFHRELRVRK